MSLQMRSQKDLFGAKESQISYLEPVYFEPGSSNARLITTHATNIRAPTVHLGY
jgi:hypothetical protein